MKKLFFFISGMLMTFSMFARDFKYEFEGHTLVYTVLDEAAKTCMTKEGDNNVPGNNVTGDLIIPAIASDGTNDYTVSALGARSFAYCRYLTSVTLPYTVNTICDRSFYDCRGITSIAIPNSVTSIDYTVFIGCDKLISIDVAADNTQYKSVNGVLFNKDISILIAVPGGKSGHYEIPCTVSTIGAASLAICGKLTSITIPESVKKIEDMAFFGCYGLSSITIPNSVTSIGDYAFQQCLDLRAVNISESITKIGVSTFCKCEKLTSVRIPDSVKSIGMAAFSECSNLTSVTLPKDVTTIDEKVFEGCRKILEVNYDTADPIEASADLFEPIVYRDATLNIAVGGLEKMQTIKPWMNFAHINEKYYSGIEEPMADSDMNMDPEVFNLQGVKIKDSIDMLPAGIYIINGKKTFVR